MFILGSGPVLLGIVFIGFFSITLFIRRRLSSRRSGGSLFSPYHISNGIFYIHESLCFSRRMIPLKEIKQITYLLLRGRWWWKSLRFLYRTQKWKDHTFLFW